MKPSSATIIGSDNTENQSKHNNFLIATADGHGCELLNSLFLMVNLKGDAKCPCDLIVQQSLLFKENYNIFNMVKHVSNTSVFIVSYWRK